ncbi:MAG: response regulator [Anaerolineae bacterium]|nr:response regulator [Anaerolineae bacterium]
MTAPSVLIVEDDEMISEVFSLALRAGGFEIVTARDGPAALARLAETATDLVVLDLHLPHIAGPEILARIRADERFTCTKVIVTTADYRLADTLSNQADLVLLKPVSPDQLRLLASRLVAMPKPPTYPPH